MAASSITPVSRCGCAGFTLVELLVVMAIIGLLAMVATPQVMKHLSRAKSQTARMEVKNIAMALDLFRIDLGRYPAQDEGLAVLLKQPSGMDAWKGPYLEKKDGLLDPWGNAYLYKIPGESAEYDLLSYGADNKEGGTGENADISNH